MSGHVIRISQETLDAHIAGIIDGTVRIIDLGSRGVHFELYTNRSDGGEGIGYYTEGAFHCWDEATAQTIQTLASSPQPSPSARSGG